MLAVIAATAVLAPVTIELQRGAPLPTDPSLRYWAAEDTFVEAANPDRNFGRDALLTAGPGRTVLIRFGDLRRAIGPGRRVARAELRLRLEIGTAPELSAIGRMLQPWGEGPGRRGFFGRRVAPPAGEGPPWAATWRHRRAGPQPIGWQRPGADGPNDFAAIEGAKTRYEDGALVIEGLGPAVQAMAERWYENHGFGLKFANGVDFASSDAARDRPVLRLELENAPPASGPDLTVLRLAPEGGRPQPGTNVTWVARIRNQGDAPGRAASVEWRVHGRRTEVVRLDQRLGPGEEVMARLTLPFRPVVDRRQQELVVRVRPDGPDAQPGNDALAVHEGALPVALSAPQQELDALAEAWGMTGEDALQELIRLANETVLPHSRFSFAPEGSLERVRLADLTASGQPPQEWAGVAPWLRRVFEATGLRGYREMHWDGPAALAGRAQILRRAFDLFPGLMGGGDTRDEGLLHEQISLSYEPWRDPATAGTFMPPTDLLAATDVAQLAYWSGRPEAERGAWSTLMPRTVLVRVSNTWNQMLGGLELEFFPAAGGALAPSPTFRATTSARGVATLPQGMDGANRLLLVRATRGGVTEYGWLRAWHAVDAKARAGLDLAMVNLTLALPEQAVDARQNLALQRLVVDEGGTPPARLAALVDGSAETTVDVAAGAQGWIEIDLGRDRPLGEIRMSVAGDTLWPRFDVMVYSTGERPEEARLWAQEPDGAWSLRARLDADPAMPDLRHLAYRGFPTRARFVRLVPRSPAPAGLRLAEVRVFGLTVE
jgi:hypothetical protein